MIICSWYLQLHRHLLFLPNWKVFYLCIMDKLLARYGLIKLQRGFVQKILTEMLLFILARTKVGWNHTGHEANCSSLLSRHPLGIPPTSHTFASAAGPPSSGAPAASCRGTTAGTRTCYFFLSYSVSKQERLLLSPVEFFRWKPVSLLVSEGLFHKGRIPGMLGQWGRREQSHGFGTRASVYSTTLLKRSASLKSIKFKANVLMLAVPEAVWYFAR